MAPNRFSKLRERLRGRPPAGDPGEAWGSRVRVTVAALGFVVALLGIARIAWALTHGSVWVNYRGSVLSRGQMYAALALAIGVALGSIGIAVTLRSPGRRRRE